MLQNFGDIFFTEDQKEYVFLFAEPKTIYAAIILNFENTKEVKYAQKSADKKGTSHENPMFCYVELSTSDYIDCSANMITAKNGMENDSQIIRHSSKRLEEVDLKNIKTEILNYEKLFRPGLVEYMKSIPL
jgi:hypothetical protein